MNIETICLLLLIWNVYLTWKILDLQEKGVVHEKELGWLNEV